MYLSKVSVQNFRLLKNTTFDVGDNKLSILIGRNNSGKTSFISIFSKFLKSHTNDKSFNFDDFSLSLRKSILEIDENTNVNDLSIRLILEINYSKAVSYEFISNLFLNLDGRMNESKILFECSINKNKLLKSLVGVSKEHKKRYIMKNFSDFLEEKIYLFLDDDDYLNIDKRKNLVPKKIEDVKSVINFQVIDAKRDVSSSSESSSNQTLSKLATSYFNKNKKLDASETKEITDQLLKFDKSVESTYEKYFSDFLNDSKSFLDMDELKVISNIEANEILEHSSKIVYGSEHNQLPEHLNGLGYMNILYLLLQIKIKREYFIEAKKDINLFFIEEPEAHTHPQMLSVFIREVEKILIKLDVQTFISTHSSHVVKYSNFQNIRYFQNETDNIRIKNFYVELEEKYKKEPDLFSFLKQYLTITSSELFFAEKVIFIEGLTERLLLPYFIREYDSSNSTNIASQNISILEVGANANAFKYFIEFLGIKTLIITDIDTTVLSEGKKPRYKSCPVVSGENTSNATLKAFLNAPDIKAGEFETWLQNLKENKLDTGLPDLLKISYQTDEDGYHGRSFEEAFMSLNLANIKSVKPDLLGLKNIDKLDNKIDDSFTIDNLTESILGKKSSFASSLLFLALTDKVKWATPQYILNGLKWIEKK